MTAITQWTPLLPPILIVALGFALLAVLCYGSWLLRKKHVPRRAVLLLGGLRALMIGVILLGLFQPVLSVPRTFVERPGLLVLIDTSASMAAPAEGGTRLDEIRQRLRNSPAIQAAARQHTLHWYGFDRRAYPVLAEDLNQLEPRGDTTDVAAALKSAWQDVRLRDAARGLVTAPRRVLLVSDGQHRSPADVVSTARDIGLAIDTLAPARDGNSPLPAASEIVLVQSAPRVLIGSDTVFQVAIRPQTVLKSLTLHVEEEGREIQQRELKDLRPGEDQTVLITHQPQEVGLKRYQFHLQDGAIPFDVPYAVNVQVTDNRHDILILEDTWRWEFKYLRRVLEDDPSFHLTAMLSRGEKAFVQFGEPDRRVRLGGFPQSRAELDGFDTFVLGDIRPATWPRGLARHLAAAVTEGGRSLVIIAGPHLGEWIDTPELTRLLPVEITTESGTPVAGPLEVRITSEGNAAGWFQLSDRKAAGEPAAAKAPVTLPHLDQIYPSLKKRPAATVLLEAVGQQNAYGPLIVMAEHTVGRGRVLFVGTDTLWRWQTQGPQTAEGVTHHAAFWQQAFRALAPVEPALSQHQIFLRPAQTQYQVGDHVRLTAEQMSVEGAAAAVVEATIQLPDGRRVPLSFTADERDTTQMTADFEPSQTGRYRVDVALKSESLKVAESSAEIEVGSRRSETGQAPVDVAALARWSASTAGHAVDPLQPEGWVPAITGTRQTVTRRESFDLWHNMALLLVLSALFAVDWTVRLFRGFV